MALTIPEPGRAPGRGQLVRTLSAPPVLRLVLFQLHRDGAWLLNVNDAARLGSFSACEWQFGCSARGMFRTFAIPLTWKELLTRTYRESVCDDVLGLAAQLAYYFLLALAPAVVFIAALASLFPASLLEQMTGAIANVAPGDVSTIISDQLRTVAGRGNTGLLTVGLAM